MSIEDSWSPGIRWRTGRRREVGSEACWRLVERRRWLLVCVESWGDSSPQVQALAGWAGSRSGLTGTCRHWRHRPGRSTPRWTHWSRPERVSWLLWIRWLSLPLTEDGDIHSSVWNVTCSRVRVVWDVQKLRRVENKVSELGYAENVFYMFCCKIYFYTTPAAVFLRISYL